MTGGAKSGAVAARARALCCGLATMAASVLLMAGCAELLLRILPVVDNPLVVPVSKNSPVFHYMPGRPFLFSRDWNLRLVNHGWVNNAGMVNDQEYRRADSLPLLAVIGDSFIEALMVPYPQTLQGRLAARLRGRIRVYSFGASGAPMSQYLVWAREAVEKYGAEALVINIVGNDFDESHEAYKRDFPGFWTYKPGPGGALVLTLNDFHAEKFRNLIKHSALARYLLVDAHLKSVFSRRTRHYSVAKEVRYAGNTEADMDSARLAASYAVISAFLRDLPPITGLPPSRVLFTVDGFRYPEAAAKGRGTYFDLMRKAFQDSAAARGYEVIDMDTLFFAHFRLHHQPFQDSRDLHWNSLAHGIAENAVLRSRLLSSLQP